MASATSASASLVFGGLSTIMAIAAVAATNAPLRAYQALTAAAKPTTPGGASSAATADQTP